MAENYIDKIEVDGVERPIRDTSGSVRYDAPQTLSDGQKTQARGNINAAPGGFGLGSEYESYIADFNACIKNGWYKAYGNSLNYPSIGGWDARYGVLLVSTRESAIYHVYYVERYSAMYTIERCSKDGGTTWSEWEYVHPPMESGVEYRTTERYLGRPVYVQLVDLGACPSSGYKDVVLADETIRAIRCTGRWSFNGGSTVPFYSTNLDCLYIGCLGRVVRITTGGKDFSEYTAQATVHYIKTTD